MFDHEKLEVYQESLRVIAWLEPLLESSPDPFQSEINSIAPVLRSH